MMIKSAMNEGLSGMQQSQRRMQQAAEDIVRAGVPTERNVAELAQSDRAVTTNNGAAVDDISADQAIEALPQTDRAGGLTVRPRGESSEGNLVDPLIQQKKEQLMFDASANVVKAANNTLGTVIDDLT